MRKIVLMLSIVMLSGSIGAFAQFDYLGVEEENQSTSDIEQTKNENSLDEEAEAIQAQTSEKVQNFETEESEIIDETAVSDISKNNYFTDFIEDVEAEKTAKKRAKSMLDDAPKIIKLRQNQIKELEKNKIEREKLRQKFISREQEKMKPEEKVQNIIEEFENAPLGFLWAISPEKMQQIGYELEQVEREGYPNSYLVKNAEIMGASGYKNVIVSFGENNELWCINAQTIAQKDEPTAKETLKLYDKYFSALSEKYGNANEHFSPFSYEEEITREKGKKIVTQTIQKENPRGNPDFLKELQTGKAELYSTFHNNNIGVTLSVYVDENSEGQLVLDYKNLLLLKKEKEIFINNL